MRRLCFGLALSFLALACAAEDPGVEGLTRGEFTEGGASGDSGPKSDGGAKDGGATDAAGEASAGTTAFTGANAFTSNPPATTAAQRHSNTGVGVTPGKGVDCLGCHKMGGSGPTFLFAGTLFSDQNGNTPAAGKEVRVRGSDGKAFSAYSDTDGNFWYEPGSGEAVAFPALSGARDGSQTALMTNNLAMGSCNANGCHDGSTQPYMHLP